MSDRTELARVDERAALNIEGLKTEFFRSNMKLSQFCTLYEDTHPGLQQLAHKESWITQRKQLRETMSIEARRRLFSGGADYEAKLDGMTHRATNKLVRLISGILTNVAETEKLAREGGAEGKRLGLDDLPKIRSGIEALAQAHKLARITAHLTPEPVPTGSELDLSRLNHEERVQLNSLLKKSARGQEH